MNREDKIYMAYKVALAKHKKNDIHTAPILAMIHTSKAFKISVFTMLDIAKRRATKK
jgi:hypothetical protein